MKEVDPNDPNLVLSPLADPVVGAIFASAEVAGLASKSIIDATLKAENELPLAGKIIRVTPQYTHPSPLHRGCRLDVDIETDLNEFARYEVQISPELHIMERNLFSAARLFTQNSKKGDTSAEMAAKMPKVIYINLLGYILRKSNNDMVQPFKIMYTKPPHEVAIENFGGYNIQLPKVLEMDENFDDDLYCWCYALYTAHVEKRTVREVIAMTAGLQAFAERDAGFQQFNERYEHVAADPKARQEYADWFNESLRQQGMIDYMEREVRDEYERKLAESERRHKEDKEQLIKNMKRKGMSIEDIAEMTGLSVEEIENI